MKAYKKYIVLALIPIWFLLYNNLSLFIDFLVNKLLKLNSSNPLTETIRFFLFEFPKVLLLLVFIVFLVGIIRSFFSPEKTRKKLEGMPLFVGNVMAGLLGIVTPFCSCSAIPLFLGFVESGIPLGVTFSFLISAPMINEVAVILLFSLFGLKTTLIYISTGLFISIFSGWLIGILHLEHWVEDWVYKVNVSKPQELDIKLSVNDRIDSAFTSIKDIVSKVWLYILFGILIGSFAHGYVPAEFMAGLMGKDIWYSVPLSVLIGIPLYSNAAGIVPIVQVLMEKGASLGTALAFMMSVIGLSLPEIIILKKVLKMKLIFTFVGIVGFGIMIVGFLFNFIL